MYRPPTFFPIGVNMYCPAMTGSAEFTSIQPVPFSLGKPTTASVTAVTGGSPIAANGAGGTVTPITYTADATYGRVMSYKPSADPGNACLIDVQGTDYLGQPMVERVTGVNGSAAAIAGKKAFYRITGAKIVTPSANAVTLAIGTATRLGLPFKSMVGWVKEGGTQVVPQAGVLGIPVRSDSAGKAIVRMPGPGYIQSIEFVPPTDAKPDIVAKVNDVAIPMDVTDEGVATPKVNGATVGNNFAAGGYAVLTLPDDQDVVVYVAQTQVALGDTTDPATAVTGDPRGTYDAQTAPNGTNEIIVALFPDFAINAAGNGGLHGIRQFYG